jgi:hypothetical protein
MPFDVWEFNQPFRTGRSAAEPVFRPAPLCVDFPLLLAGLFIISGLYKLYGYNKYFHPAASAHSHSGEAVVLFGTPGERRLGGCFAEKRGESSVWVLNPFNPPKSLY